MNDELGALAAFVAVSEMRSFTRAASKLGTSQSALSHKLRRLEERLGVKLLTRTTRSVAPTEAGLRLLETLVPALDGINRQLNSLALDSDQPSGLIRITTADHVAETVVWPRIRELLTAFPALRVELNVENEFVDIVAAGYLPGDPAGHARLPGAGGCAALSARGLRLAGVDDPQVVGLGTATAIDAAGRDMLSSASWFVGWTG